MTRDGTMLPITVVYIQHSAIDCTSVYRPCLCLFNPRYRGKAFEEGGIKKSFKTTCKNAGIPHGRKTQNGLTFHDLRRTVKTNMLKAGLEKEYRDTILGHSLKGMDVHYLVLDEKTLTEAMNKYTKWVDGQLESANVDHSVDQEHINKNKTAMHP
jgi:integrase